MYRLYYRVDTNGDTRYNTYILRSLIYTVLHWPDETAAVWRRKRFLRWTLDITWRMGAKLM